MQVSLPVNVDICYVFFVIGYVGRSDFDFFCKRFSADCFIEHFTVKCIIIMEKHYDIGILGVWFGCNYGSIATYFALHQTLKKMGKSVLMIDKPKIREHDVELGMTHSRRFAKEHYDISPCYGIYDFYKLNDLCDGFAVGSDQVWNYGISSHTGYLSYLNFARDDKLKFSYAASLGHSVDFAPENERAVISKFLSRFDGISVREGSGVDLLRDCYGINAVQVLDPVFLADVHLWDELASKSEKKDVANEKYLVTYILDPTEEKRKAILHIAKKLGNLKVINVLDGLPWLFEKNRELMNLPNCIENVQVEDWLCFIRNSEFVITDSCHGLSFAIIFRKPFVSFANKKRGYTRFASLSRLLGFEDRLVTDTERVYTDKYLLDSIDYEAVEQILIRERKKSLNWLSHVLDRKQFSGSDSVNADDNNQGSPYIGANMKKSAPGSVISLLKNAAPKYNHRQWYQTLSPDGIAVRYIPQADESGPGRIIFFKLEKYLIRGQKYHARIVMKVHSRSPLVSVHVVNSDVPKFQIIHKLIKFVQGKDIIIDADFVVREEGVNCLSFGASQVTGSERFLELDQAVIVPVAGADGNFIPVSDHRDVPVLSSGIPSRNVSYKFSSNVWEIVKLDDNEHELLRPKFKDSKPRNFGYVLLPDEINMYPSCIVKFQFYLRSSSPFVNIHLANSRTGKFTVVRRLVPDNTKAWQEMSLDYVRTSRNFDSVMVGALQISGDDRCFGVRNIEVVKSERNPYLPDAVRVSLFRRHSVMKVVSEHRCTGCGACANLCPKNAIKMTENREGFLVPEIDTAKCIDCGICLKKCISEHPVYKNNEKPECLAVMADDDIRKVSSSGGVFSLLANYFFQNNGYVCGAAYKDDFSVRHIIIKDVKDLPLLRGSKYMQSQMGDVYQKIRNLLSEKHPVLFTGLPCQVAGLYSFLNRDYDNLYTVDLLCHGISSSKVFNKYHQDVLGGKSLTRLEFKEKEPWGWHAGVNAYFNDGTKHSEPIETDLYMVAYLKSLSKNSSCGTCVSNHLPRQGDLTIGDFWGISRTDPEMHDKKGTSVVLVNNAKGQKLFDSIKEQAMKYKRESIDAAIRNNLVIKAPYILHKNRDQFFDNFEKYDFRSLVDGCIRNALPQVSILPDDLKPEDVEYYYVARHVAIKAGTRSVVAFGVSKIFENVLKSYFGLAVSYYVTNEPQKADNRKIFMLDHLKDRVDEVFLVSCVGSRRPEVVSVLESYGYLNLQDYIFRIHEPVVLRNFDLARKRYSDSYGNTIEGDTGVISSIVIRGCNCHIMISGSVAGLNNLSVDVCSNSTVSIGDGTRINRPVMIHIIGIGGFSEIAVGKSCRITDAIIRVYNHPAKSSVRIGNGCTFESDLELHANSGKKIVIGNDCMFSHGIDLWAGDGHAIFDVNTARNINSDYDALPEYKNRISIGDHVWVGKEAFIMHGTEIGSGSVIGAKSVVKGRYPNNSVVAGNPAECVKTDVAWSRNMLAADMNVECGEKVNIAKTRLSEHC